MLWGGAVNPQWDAGETMRSAFDLLRKDSGRRLDVAHFYRSGDELFPNEQQLALQRSPQGPPIFYFNWKVAPEMTWRAIASGAADARIDAEAAHLKKTLTEKFFLTISHEPEYYISEDPATGNTVEDYNAMFRHVVERLRGDGVDNAVIVMSYRGNPVYATRSWWDQLWPGDDVVDWVAGDIYVFDNPDFGQDFPEALNRTNNGPEGWPGFYNWADRTHHKPIMLGEWGLGQNYDDATISDKLVSLRKALPQLKALKALIYWDIPVGGREKNGTRMHNDARREAFARLARSPEVVGFREP